MPVRVVKQRFSSLQHLSLTKPSQQIEEASGLHLFYTTRECGKGNGEKIYLLKKEATQSCTHIFSLRCFLDLTATNNPTTYIYCTTISWVPHAQGFPSGRGIPGNVGNLQRAQTSAEAESMTRLHQTVSDSRHYHPAYVDFQQNPWKYVLKHFIIFCDFLEETSAGNFQVNDWNISNNINKYVLSHVWVSWRQFLIHFRAFEEWGLYLSDCCSTNSEKCRRVSVLT